MPADKKLNPPTKLAEPFFVLRRHKIRKANLVLHLRSGSYDMGTDRNVLLRWFADIWGFDRFFIDRCIDVALEFGAAQVIPEGQRCIPLHEHRLKKKPEPGLFADDTGEQERSYEQFSI